MTTIATKTVSDGDWDEIYTNLYQGGAPTQMDELRRDKFDVIVFCATDFQPSANAYFPTDCIFCPFKDNDAGPSPAKLKEIYELADKISMMIMGGKKVLITCAAGLNRSGLLTALVINKLTGWGGAACINLVRSKRRIVAGMSPLYNQAFVKILQSIK